MRAALGKFGSRVAGAVRSPLSLEARAAAFVVFVCVVLVLLDGWRTLHARTVQLHETVVHTENLARTLAEQADDTISSVDLVILGQVERVENDGTGAVQMDRLHRFLATRVAAMPALRALSVYGPDGELIVAAAPPEAGEGNIRDREDFSFLRSHVEDGAHISPARRIGTKGEWVITVSRRIVGPDGGFAGIVAADIALDYFQNYYRTIDLGDEGVVVLVLSSGQILARWPLAEASIGQGVPNRQALDSVRAGAVNGREARSSIDGIVRISSGRELDRYPVALFVGLGKNEVLAEWRRDALSNLVGLASLVLLIGLLGIPLTSAIRRRAAAERTAAAAAAELKLLADNATDMIIQADLAGGCGFVSPGSRHVLGREPEELTGTSIIDLIHPDDVGPTRRALVALITKGEYDTITHRLRHRDGHYVWIEAGLRLVRDPETGAPLEIVSVSRDISQRKEAEAHLLDAVESINDGFVLFDADWRFVMCNTRYREIYPKSGDFLVPGIKRRTLLMAMSARGEFGPVDDPERFIDTFLAQNAESGSIFERPLADGRWILGSDRRTSMGSWVGIRTDITEQKRREFDLTDTRERLEIQAVELVKTAEDLAALKDEAERANQVKSEFLAMMSHEIRTPMNGIIGMNGLLLSTRLAPEQHRFAEAVRMSAESLLTIINDILDVSKLEAGKIDLEIVDFNLAEIVEDAVALLSPRAQQKGLETAADVAPEGGRAVPRRSVPAAPDRAQSPLQRGQVHRDRLRLRPGPDLGAGDRRGRPGWRHAGADRGARYRDRRHRRGEGEAVPAVPAGRQLDLRRFGGTGLGLNISRQLVELMGGRIGIADRLGGGSIFWLELTLPAGDSHLEEPVAPAEGLRGQRVLVVDDTEINRFILRRQLTANGMAVTEAEDGASALAALAEAEAMGRPFDVVVLDQVMPTLSGELVAETIRERSDWHQPKLVLLSSAGQPTRSGNLGERGFDAVLVKPMRQQALVECLARLAAPPVIRTRSTKHWKTRRRRRARAAAASSWPRIISSTARSRSPSWKGSASPSTSLSMGRRRSMRCGATATISS